MNRLFNDESALLYFNLIRELQIYILDKLKNSIILDMSYLGLC